MYQSAGDIRHILCHHRRHPPLTRRLMCRSSSAISATAADTCRERKLSRPDHLRGDRLRHHIPTHRVQPPSLLLLLLLMLPPSLTAKETAMTIKCDRTELLSSLRRRCHSGRGMWRLPTLQPLWSERPHPSAMYRHIAASDR